MKYGLSYTLIIRLSSFLGRTIFYYRKNEMNFIFKLLESKENIKILDYGCNTGYMLNSLKNKFPKFSFTGADINTHAIKYARKKYKGIEFYKINESFFKNMKNKYDVVILSHVLEHVNERQTLIKGIKRLLKDDNKLIVVIPQERIRGDCTLLPLFYNFIRLRFENPHVAKINYTELNELLNKANFNIVKHTYTNLFYPFKSDKKRLDSLSLVVLSERNN